jgi:hypothetical protein
LAYEPPASSTFLSEQTSDQQPANSTFLSEQTSTSHQQPAERTGCTSLQPMTSFPLEAAVVRPANNELVATWSFASNSSFRDIQPVRLAYQPPVSSTFLSNKLTNNNQSPVPLFYQNKPTSTISH